MICCIADIDLVHLYSLNTIPTLSVQFNCQLYLGQNPKVLAGMDQWTERMEIINECVDSSKQ